MTALKGYVGAFYIVSDASVYSDISAEAVGTGTGAATDFALVNENVEDDPDLLTVAVSGVSQQRGADFTFSPDGRIVFSTAPTSDYLVTADYRYYPNMIQAGGFYSWAFEVSSETLDDTDFSTTGWRSFCAGLKGWTGSAERHWSTLVTSDFITMVGSKTIVKFFLDEGNVKYYTGWAQVTGVNPSTSVEALVEEPLTLQGTELMRGVGT